VVAPTRERLVDRVVDHLEHEMVETSRACRADVHARAEPDRLQALENRDVLCGIVRAHIKKALHIAGIYYL
jgi:hypothetical protein